MTDIIQTCNVRLADERYNQNLFQSAISRYDSSLERLERKINTEP